MGRIFIEPIGYIENDYKEKFGIPRQSGLSESVISRVIFEDEYTDRNYFKDIQEFSHIWLIWYFSDVDKKNIKPTVRPPKLGGNKKVGVFASRSPFRPNRIGISCVKLIKVDFGYKRITLYVTGADLMNGTPIIDIKPYLPYTDSRPDATNGFAFDDINGLLDVKCSDEILSKIPIAPMKISRAFPPTLMTFIIMEIFMETEEFPMTRKIAAPALYSAMNGMDASTIKK